ncbi:MAG: alpha/beta fold hydrolase [Chitinophagaceae bacterium]
MQKPKMKRIRKWLGIAAIIYVVIGAALYFFQEKILFHPQKLALDHKYNFSNPYKEINLRVTDEKSIGIVQFTGPDSLCKGVVLYFHGNKKNIERYSQYATNFTSNNYEVWMMDYPGFGKSTGERTEQILYNDALEFYKMAMARFSKDSIIIYGKSMGTGIAAQLASRRDCKRLILETPYYDFPSVIQHYFPMYPMNVMLHYKIPTHEYLKQVTAPVTIFHGTDDGVITYSNAERLIPFLPKNSEFITIKKGSHNDLYEFGECKRKLDSVLAR